MSVYHVDILDTFFKYLYQTETEADLIHKLIIDSEEVKEALSEIDFQLETEIIEIENPILNVLREVEHRRYGDIKQNKIVANAFEEARQAFLDTDSEKCFFLDDDIMIKENTIQELVNYDKEIISANFMLPNANYSSAFKAIYPAKSSPVVHFGAHEIEDLREVAGCGTSALIVNKEVLEQIKFRIDEGIGGAQDVPFSLDVRELGYQPYLAGDTKVGHLWNGEIYYPHPEKGT